ncbi:sulfite exporter TauE/SafE family protein [Collimonas sp.]|uniref:sulfite exporter TauE/SafE family protein n=1 Tax=Collimonas sp. TaxID=1963772 RepID=UPI002C8B4972|nr:sulfite exporter TauE/SafE family protein [Collimonas sp.]HWX01372.1 sulfite exporter TauE/SafE family protein [Collimonas sp.]
MLIFSLFVYIATGCIAGYLAGLFGVGGGIIIVPVLTTLFKEMGIESSVIMPLAIGTSMAVVFVTSMMGARAHHANGNVDFKTAKELLPAIVVGVIIGAIVGSSISRNALAGCVIAFEVSIAGMFLYQVWHREGHAEEVAQKQILQRRPMFVISGFLGVISSVVGIAGGTLFVPLLGFDGIHMRKAIGTASALGVPISIIAAFVYIVMGLMGDKVLPAYSLGFVYLPAFAGCVIGSLWSTKHGAILGKRLNLRWLKLAFALILLAAASKMLFS